jgi:hypothetical protein
MDALDSIISKMRGQIEQHADLEHEIWSSWMRYMFTKGTYNPDGTWTMDADKVQRWQRQMNTPYSRLTEQEQGGDRVQVMKHLHLDLFGEINRKEGTQWTT